jgi:hypothetical protein
MAYRAPDYNNIIRLFNEYRAAPDTRVPTILGFRAYLLNVVQYPAWVVKALNRQISQDPELKFHLNTVIEANIVEGALTGVLKSDSVKFILKNHYNYSDTPEINAGEGATTKQVVYKPAVKPAQLEEKHE